MPGDLAASEYPHYCAHRRECFPGWHRGYIVAFEEMFRRADQYNQAQRGEPGGDLGLPYWDWTTYRVHGPNSPKEGECFPRIVREKLLVDFTAIPGFFPAAVAGGKPRRDYSLQDVADEELGCAAPYAGTAAPPSPLPSTPPLLPLPPPPTLLPGGASAHSFSCVLVVSLTPGPPHARSLCHARSLT